jgi:iron complex outermembrane recepter protein
MRKGGVVCAWAYMLSLLLLLAPQGVARAQDRDSSLVSDDLSEMSLEQLGNIQVTSVSRRAEPLSDAAASVYVITAEDNRRSGAQTLPEALRLAPSLEVARADANQYAITARGFASVLANKMLVLIDGRTVYSPLFSGVFWEAQDVLLEDVDRIEVISGPGGTSWGTNAVNGVINIITRTAAETKGVLAAGGGGDRSRGGEARVGWGSGPYFRVHGKYGEQDHSQLSNGSPVRDASRRWGAGGRMRWTRNTTTLFLDGGGYENRIDQVPSHRWVSGYHLLGSVVRQLARGPSLRLQAYYDHTRRDQPGAVQDFLDTYDVELQSEFNAGRHSMTLGAGYRYQPDDVENLTPALAFIPADRDLRHADVFAEDQVALGHRVRLNGGLRLEHNVYTGWEYLPTVRLSWRPKTSHFLWVAGSRAVRAPSRVDREFFIPAQGPPFFLAGGPVFRSEILHAVELGYRGQPLPSLSYSVAGYVSFYDRLRSLEPTPIGSQFENGLRGRLHGIEGWVTDRVMSWCHLSAGGGAQRTEIDLKPGSQDVGGRASLGIDPDHWWTLRSSFDAGRFVEFDAMLRHVGALPMSNVPRYTSVDGRVGWRPVGPVELSVSGTDLFGPRHAEWGASPNRATFGRSAYAKMQWRL